MHEIGHTFKPLGNEPSALSYMNYPFKYRTRLRRLRLGGSARMSSCY
jgi:hypothetical protein